MESSSDNPLILILDEIWSVVRLIELELSVQGYRTHSALISDDPIALAERLQPDAIVLGAAFPVPTIYDVLERLRGRVASPILFLHAGGNEVDGALAMELGAADVVGAPFKPDDLALRLRALVDGDMPEARILRRGTIRIDPLRRIVWNGDAKIALSTGEWSLLLMLINAGRRVPAVDLLKSIWGDDYANETRFLQLWIQRLRINLGDDPANPQILIGNLESGFELI